MEKFTNDNLSTCFECFKSYEHSSCFEFPSNLDDDILAINLKRILPSFCDICDIIHEKHEYPYIYLQKKSEGTFLYFNCNCNIESKLIGILDFDKIPDYERMTSEEKENCRLAFKRKFDVLFRQYSIQISNIDSQPLENIDLLYRETKEAIIKSEKEKIKELEKENFISTIKSLFPLFSEEGIIIDCKKGLLKKFMFEYILSDSKLDNIKIREIITKYYEKSYSLIECKKDIIYVTIALFFWLLQSSESEIIKNDSIIIERENIDIEMETISNKIIKSPFFFGEEVILYNVSPSKIVKTINMITKITFKDLNKFVKIFFK
jgi:hypothetical protein